MSHFRPYNPTLNTGIYRGVTSGVGRHVVTREVLEAGGGDVLAQDLLDVLLTVHLQHYNHTTSHHPPFILSETKY